MSDDSATISARRQRVLARMMLEPGFERRVRDEPDAVASEERVDVAYVRGLAAISEQRVREFRASQRHKDEVRAGKQPKRV